MPRRQRVSRPRGQRATRRQPTAAACAAPATLQAQASTSAPAQVAVQGEAAGQAAADAGDVGDAAATPAAAPTPGTYAAGKILSGRYRLHERLATGGMGRVYRATQLALGREVAIKLLRHADPEGRGEVVRRRFFAEARAAAKLQHPHSVVIYDYGCDEHDTPYLVMEYLRGPSLGQLLRQCGPLAPQRALRLAIQVGRAVQAAHAMGAVHRDLKPENLMLVDWGEHAQRCSDDFVKVVDFGLVKEFGDVAADLTRSGQYLGSPGYMAPEQILGEPLDGRCDVYALGAILFEMLAGRPPFAGTSPHETMRAHVQGETPELWPAGDKSLTVLATRNALEAQVAAAHNAALQQLVATALQKDPAARFASMAQMLGAMAQILDALAQRPGAQPAAVRSGQTTLALLPAAVDAAEAAAAPAKQARGECTVLLTAPPRPDAAGQVTAAWAGQLASATASESASASASGSRSVPAGAMEATVVGAFAAAAAPGARAASPAVAAGDAAPTQRLRSGAWPAPNDAAPPAGTRPPWATDRLRSWQGRALHLVGALALGVSVGPTHRLEPPLPAQTAHPAAAASPPAPRASPAPQASPTPQALQAPDVAAALASPPAPTHAPVTLHFDSVPQGAAVHLGSQQLCPATPCAVTLPAQPLGGRLLVRFSLPAHDDHLAHVRLPTPAAPARPAAVRIALRPET